MKRILLVIVVVLVAGVGAFFGYWQLTKFDRTMDTARSGGYLDSETRQYLAQHTDKPEVLAFFRQELKRYSAEECRRTFDLSGFKGEFDAFDAVFSKQGPGLGEGFIPEAVKFLSVCGDVRVKQWIPNFDNNPAVTEAILTQLEQDNINRHGAKVVFPVLLQRGPVVTDRVVEILTYEGLLASGSALKPLLQVGFPRNGAKLSDRAAAVAPDNDPRLHRAYAKSVIKMSAKMNKYSQPTLEAVSKVLSAHPPAPSEGYLRGLGWIVERYTDPAHNGKPAIAMAQALGPAGTAMMRRIMQMPAKRTDRARWESRVGVGKLLNTMGSGDATSFDVVLNNVVNRFSAKKRSFFYDQRHPVSRPPPDVANAVAGIVPMGTAAVPTLRTNLNRDHWVVNEVVVRAWAAIDAGGLADDLAKRLATKWWDHAAVQVALELLRKSPKNDARLAGFFFRLLFTTDKELARKANLALGDRVATEPMVDGIFAYLDQRSRYSAQLVSDVHHLLSTKPGGTAAFVRNLEQALQKADGRPQRVFWLHKYLAMSYLQNHGTKDALPILLKFQADPGGFKNITTSYDRRSGRTLNKQATVVPFRKLAVEAITAIRKRSR